MTFNVKTIGVALAALAVLFYKKNSDTIKKLQNALTSEINAREADVDELHEKTGDFNYDLKFTPKFTLDYSRAGAFFSQLVIEVENNNSEYSYRLGDFIASGIRVFGMGINTFKPYNDTTYDIAPKTKKNFVVWQRTQFLYKALDSWINYNIPTTDYIFANGSQYESEAIREIKSALDSIGNSAWGQLDDPEREPVVLGNFSIDQLKFKVYNPTGATIPVEKPLNNITGVLQVVHGQRVWYQQHPMKLYPAKNISNPYLVGPMGGHVTNTTITAVPAITEVLDSQIYFGKNVFNDKSKEYFGNS